MRDRQWEREGGRREREKERKREREINRGKDSQIVIRCVIDIEKGNEKEK